ncbi:MAG: hypothetical protein WD013_01535 [Gemmatimonadota bacterium]
MTYPQGLDLLAPVAARHAERAHRILTESFLPPPSSTIDLVLTDHTDASNGLARIFPSPRLVIWAQPPVEGLALSHFDEWLELVILHEMVHIFHLDHAGTPGTIVRSVFGRVPWTWPAFPGYATARLGIEGVAVHLESLHSSAGRVHGGYHDAVVRSRALGGGFESVDQGLGRSPVWPGGDRPYVFGGEFFRYLSERYGEPAVVRFLDAVAGQWIPYRLDAAAEDAFGLEFERLWSDWVETVERDAERIRTRMEEREALERGSRGTRPESLTEGARYGLHPDPGPDGTGVAYVRADGRSETALALLGPDGDRVIARWNGLDPPRWTADGSLVVPQLEYVDNFRVHRDLYRVTLDGEVTRLTSGLRVLHADPSPAGSEIAVVLSDRGSTRLAVVSQEGEVVRVLREAEPGVVWSYPAWSPDGHRLAVARRTSEGLSAILVLSSRGDLQHRVTEDRSLNTAPAWAPAGDVLVWSSDRSGIPNLYGARWEGPGTPPSEIRQVTDVGTAVTFPSIDPTGEWIYASVLSGDGWEIGRIPMDPARWREPAPIQASYLPLDGGDEEPEGTAGAEDGPDPAEAGADGQALLDSAQRYSAFPTILPRYWEPAHVDRPTVLGRPVLPDAWGARTSGVDLVGRHEYQLAFATDLGEPGRRNDWTAHYRWAGLGNPAFVLETAQAWDTRSPFPVDGEEIQGSDDPDAVVPVVRERWFGGAVEWRRQRARHSATVTLGGRRIDLDRYVYELDGEQTERYELIRPSTRLDEVRMGVGISTARAYPFSVSLEDGLIATAAVRQRWDRLVPDSLSGRPGLDAAVREAVLGFRGYRGISGRGFANHVLALRVAGGVADGPASRTGHFAVGGRERRFPVRGLAAGSLRGSAAWATSIEWRFPLMLVHRGAGTWPIYLDRLAGSVFLDAAGVRSELEAGGMDWDSRSSVGLEIATTVSIFFEGLDLLRVGVAVPIGPAGDRSGRASFYLGTGWSF